MEVRDLKYFMVAAELGQFRLAAERIGRSQPALTKCIDRLEAELEAKLFERSGRGVRLTAAGHALMLHARTISLNVRDAIREVRDIGHGIAGHIRIGSGPTTTDWLLPSIVGPLVSQSPDLTFQIVTGLGDSLRKSLQEGKLDLVVGPIFQGDPNLYNTHDITDDTMVVAARPDHPLMGRRIKMEELEPYRWILPLQPHASTQWLTSTFEAHGLSSPIRQVETDAVTHLRRVVAQSDLLTFISKRDLRGADGAPLRRLDVKELTFVRRLGILSMRGRYISPPAERVISRLIADGRAILNKSL